MKYSQSSGILTFDDGTTKKGHAGIPAFSNDADADNRKDEGPLPRGWYGMTIHDGDLGNKKGSMIILHPDAGNVMHGRDNFLIHGGDANASQGCIIINQPHRGDVVEAVKKGDSRLEVVR